MSENSTKEYRMARVRFDETSYADLLGKAEAFIRSVEQSLQIPEHLMVRWEIIQTSFHDNEMEGFPDDYPVVLIESSLIVRDTLWPKHRCSCIVVIDSCNLYLIDEDMHQLPDFDVMRVIREALTLKS
jgi:hypothetical protein